MKKLTCSNCGGLLKISTDKQTAKCQNCDTEYKLSEDLNINIKIDDNTKESLKNAVNPVKKVSFFIIIFIVVIFISITVFIIIHFVNVFKSINNTFNTDNYKKTANVIDKAIYNNMLEVYKGTKNGNVIYILLDEINTMNKKNSDKIIVKYMNEEYVDSNDITNIKKGIEKNKEYEVSFEYNDNGYIHYCEISLFE